VAQEALVEEMVAGVNFWRRKEKKLQRREKLGDELVEEVVL
jgi:hypothetical protein